MSDSPIFLDVEASGIARGSFPVEVGHASVRSLRNGQLELVLRSHLVRPTSHWRGLSKAWDSAAEPIHGLTRNLLEFSGQPIGAVCDMLDAELANRSVHADTGGNGWDADWITTLYEAASRSPRHWQISERTSGAAVADHFRDLGLNPRVIRPLLTRWLPPMTHAAAEDAQRYAWEWAAAESLCAMGLRDATVEDAMAILDALPSPLPPELWPSISADSVGHFRPR